MPGYLRQSTVAVVKFGPCLGPDGIVAYTTAGFTVKVAANGGTLAARHDTTAIAHDADGYFVVELDATDVAAVGRLKLEVPGSAGNYLPVWDDFTVLSQAVYDSLFGSTMLGVNVVQIAGSATAATNLHDDELATTPVLAATDSSGRVTLAPAQSFDNALDDDFTAAAFTSTSLTLAPADPAKATSQVGNRILITGGTLGVGQEGTITGSNTTTGAQAMTGGWSAGVTPTGAVKYIILPPGGTGGGGGVVTGYATGQAPDTLVWAATTRSLTDKAGFSLAVAPPTASAITTAVVAAMATAPVGSVANITPVSLPTGIVSASPAPTSTSFTATGSLIAAAAAYAPTTKRIRFALWMTGANAGETSSIATYPGSGAFTLDFSPTGAIAAGDTFVVI